ncbi:putative membrane protein [Halolactibacillus halophilus]|uniref:Putative membrane protein n=1 Tax=Halolactibacillus halophilus TaxID=306540 RepID=A0A1I5LVV9_9BACI|nr:YhgE/Pip domain-containing protein [Halolactibacillus halophilus]GEM00898.1 hypothetical protein HHA03_04300 [Halolactibacillus halophilus]SFP01362.1 putative membrane protein [Halolactibacillus halophilus]
MKHSAFLSELKHIVKNKKIIIPIIAVILVPLLYSGMFLWSFWDPYDQMESLPVAVVNLDEGATFEGTALHLGDELINQLKEEKPFDLHFIDGETAQSALEAREYYMLIEIPKDFSQHATTLLNDTPEPLILNYIPNESHNFLSAQIGETAMQEIKGQMAKQVSATYAETMFQVINDAGDGLVKAEEGSDALQNGAKQVDSGAKVLRDHLKTLASTSVTFKDGVSTLAIGANDLKQGTATLSNGAEQLSAGSATLLAGSKTIKEATTEVSDGTEALDKGISEASDALPTLMTGTETLKQGLVQAKNKLPEQLAAAITSELSPVSGLEQLNTTIDQQLSSTVDDRVKTELTSSLANAVAKDMMVAQQKQQKTLEQVLVDANMSSDTINQLLASLESNMPSQETLTTSLLEQLTPYVSDYIDGSIQTMTTQIDEGFEQYQKGVTKAMTDTETTLIEAIKTATAPTFDQFIVGADQLLEGERTLNSGLNRLSDGATTLHAGTKDLHQGQVAFVNNFNILNDKISSLNNGTIELADGATALTTGLTELTTGTDSLTTGAEQLYEGATDLSEGTDQLTSGSDELHTALSEGAEQLSSIDANQATYNMIGEPVFVNKEAVNSVPNYGTGFAPYFISLGLFVGALLMTIVFNMRTPASTPTSGIQLFISKFGIIAIAGTLQALLVAGVLLAVLDLHVKSVPLFIVGTVITSLVFMTLIQFLATTLGNVGRFIAIIILVMQLTTSAGTFPLELIPNVLQPIHHLLPMTYSVQAFKAIISSGDFAYAYQMLFVLGIFTIIHMVMTMGYLSIKYKRHPEEILIEQAS